MKRKWPWIAQQNWENTLFLHWKLRRESVERFIPEPFTLDTYEGKAWVTVVMFQATNSRFRYTPSWMSYPAVPQINIRTYVRFGEQEERGVYFFSLNVTSMLITCGARTLFHLPFNQISATFNKNKNLVQRDYRYSIGTRPFLSVSYTPVQESIRSDDIALAEFLTEQYCIWQIKGDKIIKIPISHTPWTLNNVEAQLHISNDDSVIKDFDKLLPTHLQKEVRQINGEDNFIAHFSSFQKTKLYPYEVRGIVALP